MLTFNFDNTYARLPSHFFSCCNPLSLNSPELLLFNLDFAKELGLCIKKPNDRYLAQMFSGQKLPPGAKAMALPYAGHQFGHFTFLGDGRAHLLGEHVDPKGRRVDIQLKGSGKTPFSRQGDGQATLGPMLREYLISEAMNALGIPTSRSLAVVKTGQEVMRDKLYPGAILTRVAASHVRIGHFEYFAAKKDELSIKQLTQYTIDRHYPELSQSEHPPLELLNAFMHRQIDLIVDWLRVGFIHGVMNTDNMTLSGDTIDYGPCAFMDGYHPNTVFSSIDTHGRYAFANQAAILQWNLARFAETELFLYHENQERAIELATSILNQFPQIYQHKWLAMMRAKLGLMRSHPEDEALIQDLLQIMASEAHDYTNTFLELTQGQKNIDSHWYALWEKRRQKETCSIEESVMLMQSSNPVVIPRNHQVERVLQEAIEGNMNPYHQFLAALLSPYHAGDDKIAFQRPPTPSEQIYHTFCGT